MSASPSARTRSTPSASPPAARACCSAAIWSCPPAPRRCRRRPRGSTRAVINSHEIITGDFTRNPDLPFPSRDLRAGIAGGRRTGRCRIHRRDAARDRPARRFDREQFVHARLCLSEGPRAGVGGGDRARDRAERRRRRVQPRCRSPGAAAPRSIRPRSKPAPCRPTPCRKATAFRRPSTRSSRAGSNF